jgi:hypothetical protein
MIVFPTSTKPTNMKLIQLMMAAVLAGGSVCASPYDSMPPIPPPEKKIADYTVQDIVGCVFGDNMAQPKEHPLRVKDPGAKLKAEWPGAKVATNVDLILPYILLAETPVDDGNIGDGIYWILFEVMDVSNSEKAAAFARVYAAQTEAVNRRKVAFLGRLLFPWLADERVLAPFKDMLDDATIYETRKVGERLPAMVTTVREEAFHVIIRCIYNDDLLRVGFPEGQYLMDAAELDALRISDDKLNEAAQCGLLKTWLNAHWQEVVAKCAEARAEPKRIFSSPYPGRRILTPLTPEPDRE